MPAGVIFDWCIVGENRGETGQTDGRCRLVLGWFGTGPTGRVAVGFGLDTSFNFWGARIFFGKGRRTRR